MKIQNRQGQVLLIAVMMLATVITVVMTIAFNSTTETQIARLEADSQKALAAAESGIDTVIKNSVNSGSTPLGTQFTEQGITGSAQVMGVLKPYFVTPLLQKDEQYTFYLSNYPGFGSPWSGSLDIYLVSENGQCPSMEVIVVTSANALERYAFNTCVPLTITNAALANNPGSPTQIDGINFQWKIPTLSITSGRIAFVKVLGGKTKLGFKSADPSVSFPIQGKTVESEARTASGVVKKVQLFQSFPQIPSNFFMTSF